MTERLLVAGLVLGVGICLVSLALLPFVPRQAPEFVVTVLAAGTSGLFVLLDIVVLRLVKARRLRQAQPPCAD